MPHPTPPPPPKVHENARPDKDRAPTNYPKKKCLSAVLRPELLGRMAFKLFLPLDKAQVLQAVSVHDMKAGPTENSVRFC